MQRGYLRATALQVVIGLIPFLFLMMKGMNLSRKSTSDDKEHEEIVHRAEEKKIELKHHDKSSHALV